MTSIVTVPATPGPRAGAGAGIGDVEMQRCDQAIEVLGVEGVTHRVG